MYLFNEYCAQFVKYVNYMWLVSTTKLNKQPWKFQFDKKYIRLEVNEMNILGEFKL